MAQTFEIRQMTRDELTTLVEWAAREGWNPGLNDADIFWHTDPDGFIAATLDGELVGGGSIVSYGGRFGFMGFFIVAPEHRGRGLGTELWHARKQRLEARLEPPHMIGMDGVFAMQAFYAKGGFVFRHRDLRFQGVGRARPWDPGIVAVGDLGDLAGLLAYDQAHFPAPRPGFVRAWVTQPDSRALAALQDGALRGYGVIRACRQGAKIGPLFADTPALAESLFLALADCAPGQPVYLDVPEVNPAALALAARHGMTEVFGCARMYAGATPDSPDEHIYGVTTFELG